MSTLQPPNVVANKRIEELEQALKLAIRDKEIWREISEECMGPTSAQVEFEKILDEYNE
jgi:hypothetical protein